MSDCKLCKSEIKGMAITCSKGTICLSCSDDVDLAEFQPIKFSNDILWVLAETYFRKGRGEKVSFESVWKESKLNLKLIKFDGLMEEQKQQKAQGEGRMSTFEKEMEEGVKKLKKFGW